MRRSFFPAIGFAWLSTEFVACPVHALTALLPRPNLTAAPAPKSPVAICARNRRRRLVASGVGDVVRVLMSPRVRYRGP